MPLTVAFLAVLLLAAGAGAQTPGTEATLPEGPFYAESGHFHSLHTRLFGTVRVRADSVEVVVSEGSVARPRMPAVYRAEAYSRVRLRAFLIGGDTDEPDSDAGGGYAEVLASIAPGEEHPVRPARFVLPRPAGASDRVGLVFQVHVTDPSSPDRDEEFLSYACGRYGALALTSRARSYRSCGVRPERQAAAGAGPARPPSRPPVRPVCVEDPGSPNFMRPSDIIVERLPGDSASSRSGERRLLSEFRPRIVGYVAGPQGMDPVGMDVRDYVPGWGAQFFGTLYAPFGLPRPIPPGLLVRVGEARGASVFIAPGSDVLEYTVLYVLLPDCTFQPYQLPHS